MGLQVPGGRDGVQREVGRKKSPNVSGQAADSDRGTWKCFLLLRSVTLAWLGLLGIVGLWIPEGSEGHFQLSFPVCHVSLLYYQPSNLGASPHATDHLRRTRGRLRGKDGYLTIHDCVQLCSDLTPHRKVNG